nr:hypothetical protein CFP56_65814 [Quercus suber]
MFGVASTFKGKIQRLREMCLKCILLKSKLKEFRLSSQSFVMNVSSNGAPTFKLNAITVELQTLPNWY